ncbi:MAG: flagellar filament capping protein FliD [Deltaproteobacteria bacterium]|jgi:flagellar hook-associated protein 2|nr:flagellar filament capping protein FliD [Deltaproteobacteria bacterium]
MASGLPPNIVDQLVEAERIPLKQIESKKVKQEDILKIVSDLDAKVGEISKNLGELTNTRGFVDTKLISGDPNIIDGSVDPGTVVNGEYSIEVSQLAQKPGAISNGFPDKDKTQMGVGYIKFDTSDGTKEVYIKGANSTLNGVVAQINGANIGMRATVVEDKRDRENPYRMLVSGLKTGDDNGVKFPTIYMLDGDQDMYFDEARPSQNAKLKLDGFDIEVPNNVVNDLIPGVTLNLKQAAPGREVRLFVKENFEAISGKIKSFVDSYNVALSFLQNQQKLQKGANGKESLGPLGGDSLTRQVENVLRRIVLAPQMGVNSDIQTMNQLGIEFNRNGILNFNQEKFNKILNAKASDVSEFFKGDGLSTGFVNNLKRELGNMQNNSFGVLANRKKGIQEKINRYNTQIEQKERQLEKKEESLRRKFADLEQKMSGLQSQASAVQGIGKPPGQ